MSKHDNRKALGSGEWYESKPLTYSPPENTRPKAKPRPKVKPGSLEDGVAFSYPCDGEPRYG